MLCIQYDKQHKNHSITPFIRSGIIIFHTAFPLGYKNWEIYFSTDESIYLRWDHNSRALRRYRARALREPQFSPFGHLDSQAEIRASLNLNTRDCKLRTLTRRCGEQSSSPHIPLDRPLTACALKPNTLRDPSRRAFQPPPRFVPQINPIPAVLWAVRRS